MDTTILVSPDAAGFAPADAAPEASGLAAPLAGLEVAGLAAADAAALPDGAALLGLAAAEAAADPAVGAELEDAAGAASPQELRSSSAKLPARSLAFNAGRVYRRLALTWGLSRQGVEKRRQRGTLLGLSVGSKGYRYPRWQFTVHGTVDGLQEVLAYLRKNAVMEWMAAEFFVTPVEFLDGQTPAEALGHGELERVLRVASLFGEQGSR
jgi:hypothetical protein